MLTYKGKEISLTLFDCDFGTKLKSIEIMKAIDLGHWSNISYDGFNVYSRIVVDNHKWVLKYFIVQLTTLEPITFEC